MPTARISKRPYLLRALYDWINDSGLTPYVVVAANSERVLVPQDFVNEGRIVLNVSPEAVRNLTIGNDVLTFDGRFSGTPYAVSVPVGNVLTIYAKETSEGMMFDLEEEQEVKDETTDSSRGDSKDKPAPRGDHLKVVK